MVKLKNSTALRKNKQLSFGIARELQRFHKLVKGHEKILKAIGKL